MIFKGRRYRRLTWAEEHALATRAAWDSGWGKPAVEIDGRKYWDEGAEYSDANRRLDALPVPTEGRSLIDKDGFHE